ncbi:hypothetical protein BH09BAC2_BH09BAC2_23470 [soil metagenome]
MKKSFSAIIILLFFSLMGVAQSGTGWEWASVSGSATNSPGRKVVDIANDASGNVYTTGTFMGTMSIDGNTIATSCDGTISGNYDEDVFIAKYNSAGAIQWLKRYGTAATASNQRAQVITSDGAGNVYIGVGNGYPDIVKYDAAGNVVWTRTLTQYEINGINVDIDGNLIVMTSNQTAKDIYKLNPSTGVTIWMVANTGIGSNSTSSFQDFTDPSGNIYYTAFTLSGSAVSIAGQTFNPTRLTTYIVSLSTSGSVRWIQALDNVQVQLSYTIDGANGRSYIQIGGGSGSTFQGVPIGASGFNNKYLELDNSGTLIKYAGASPYQGLFRVKSDGIYGFNYEQGGIAATVIYGNYYFGIPAANTQGIGVVVKYDKSDAHIIWANSFLVSGASFNSGKLVTIETGPGSLVQVGGYFGTNVSFGATNYSTTMGAGSNQTDFALAQFNGTNVQLPPTTIWTGNSNNQVWADAGNWSNGIPNGGSNSIIPAGISNYPINITTANLTGKLTVGAGVSIALPSGFSSAAGIINNGTIEVTGTGTFSGFNTSQVAPLSGSGRLLFTANSPSSFSYDINNSLEINKPGGTILSYGGTIAGSLFLTAGILKAGNPVILTDANAGITYSATSYITGTLKRAINTSGTFIFPIGGETQYDGGPTSYAPVSLTLSSISGPQYISVTFPGFRKTAGSTPNINLGTSNITTLLGSHQWYVTPDATITGGTYTLNVQTSLYTNGVTDATRYLLIKRTDNNATWNVDGVSSTSTQTGGTVNAGVVTDGTATATTSNLNSSSTFAIGISSASVASGTIITSSNWTGNAGNTTWNNASNWDNGIPNALINAVIPSGKAFYPAVFTATDNARSLQIDVSATIKLPYTFIVNANIINNGAIEVTGNNSATFNGFGNSANKYAALSGTGKLQLTDNSPGVFSLTINNSLEINRTVNYLYAQSVYVSGNVNIINGNFYTSYLGNGTFINMTNPNASITATSAAHVQGNLVRTVNTSGTYNFPIGEGTGRYCPATITTVNLSGTTNLGAVFSSTFYGGAAFVPIDNLPVSALNAGQWTITPNNAATGGTFDLSIDARGYTNGVADPSRYVLLRNGGTSWQKVDNAVISQSGAVITATVNNLPALATAEVYIIGIKGLVTQWTGAAANQSWTTASNWTNGVPDNTFKSIFVSGSTNYPVSVTVSNTSAMMDVAAGVYLQLPQNFSAPQGILNNGSLEVMGSTSFVGFNFGNTPVTGSGKIVFTSASPSSISSSALAFNNGLQVNRAAGLTVNNNTINGSLTLTNGVVTGYLILTDPNAVVTYTTTSYIIGTLKRKVNTSGTYTFPIGTADRFVPATLTLNSIAGPQNITGSFSTTINGAAPNVTITGVPVTSLLNTGIWTLTPDVAVSSGDYKITLEARAYTNSVSDPTRYVVLKRSSSASSWGFFGNNGISTEAGSVITATAGNITGFSDFAIGIGASGISSSLPLHFISFAGKSSGNQVVLKWDVANEFNNKYFIIERSKDGINSVEVGRVLSVGNGIRNVYTFTDLHPDAINYYRLVQVDYDGKRSESNTIKINLPTKTSIAVFPNPLSVGDLTIKSDAENNHPLLYKVVNTAGQIIYSGEINNILSRISFSNIPKGTYQLILSDGSTASFIKL